MNLTLKTSEDLELFSEFEHFNIYGRLSKLIAEAINDWPSKDSNDIEEFIEEVSVYFGDPTTINNLESRKFEGSNSWELESASSLIQLLTLAKKELEIKTLREVVNELFKYMNDSYGDTDFITDLQYRTTEQGGRSTPAFSKYRPQIKFDFDEMQTSGEQTFIDRDEVFPGESVKAKIRITGVEFFKKRLEEGMEFEFLEGSRIIGTGKILIILNEKLRKK